MSETAHFAQQKNKHARSSRLRQAEPNEDLTGKTMIVRLQPYEQRCPYCGSVHGQNLNGETRMVYVIAKANTVALCGNCGNPNTLTEGYWETDLKVRPAGAVLYGNLVIPYTLLFHPAEEES